MRPLIFSLAVNSSCYRCRLNGWLGLLVVVRLGFRPAYSHIQHYVCRSIGGFGRRRLVALHTLTGLWLAADLELECFSVFFFFCFVQVCLFGFNLFFYADIKSSNETNKLQHQEMAMWFDVRLTFSASVPGFFLSYFHSRSPSFRLGLFWFMELFFCLSVCRVC